MDLKGKLEFISLFQTIKLTQKDGSVIDLREPLFNLLERLNGCNATMETKINSFELGFDENSDKHIDYKNDGENISIIINTKDNSSWSNIGAYLPNTLQSLNGREILIDLSNDFIKITNNPDEDVFGVYYTHNNSCHVDFDNVTKICEVGTSNTCIFLCAGSDGFSCEKFNSPTARLLLDRHYKGTMNATRIGNCAILGRKEKIKI